MEAKILAEYNTAARNPAPIPDPARRERLRRLRVAAVNESFREKLADELGQVLTELSVKYRSALRGHRDAIGP